MTLMRKIYLFILSLIIFTLSFNEIPKVYAQETPPPISCGTVYEPDPSLPWYVCGCESGSKPMPNVPDKECCGWLQPVGETYSCNENSPASMPSSSCSISSSFSGKTAVIRIKMDTKNGKIDDYTPINFLISNSRDDEVYSIPISTDDCSDSKCDFNLAIDTSTFAADDDEQYRAVILSDTSLNGGGFDFFSCSNSLSIFTNTNVMDGPSSDFFNALNPLRTNGDAAIADQLSTPGGIVSRLLQFLFPLSGLVLFAMLVWGGFEILSKSSQGTKGLEAGKNRITAAIVGFLLLFATFWMAQIIEIIFGIVIV